MKAPVRVAVTGAAGQIGYSLLFRIAAGDMLGKDQPVILQLLELPIDKAQAALRGRDDGARGLRVSAARRHAGHADPNVAFKDADIAMLVGARPRGPGMERKDLLLENAKIFIEQGKALDARRVARHPRARRRQPGQHQRVHRDEVGAFAAEPPFHRDAATRPQPRAVATRGQEAASRSATIEKLIVWGNHSPTMYPDYRFATVGGQSLKDLINDENWNRTVFLPTVGKRGAAIIEARGLSSAASAANAAIDHVRDWMLGSNGRWVTMGVPSDGSYGIPKDVMYGVPVTTDATANTSAIEGLDIDAFSRERMDATLKELEEERAGVAALLG